MCVIKFYFLRLNQNDGKRFHCRRLIKKTLAPCPEKQEHSSDVTDSNNFFPLLFSLKSLCPSNIETNKARFSASFIPLHLPIFFQVDFCVFLFVFLCFFKSKIIRRDYIICVYRVSVCVQYIIVPLPRRLLLFCSAILFEKKNNRPSMNFKTNNNKNTKRI